MFDLLKPLIVVLAIALAVFKLAHPVALKFMEPDDFARRRKVWVALTCAGFMAPSLWLYAAVALPLIYWAATKDRHPTALYVFLLLTVPPASLPIPLPLINQFFELSIYRILSLALLVPVAIRFLRSGAGNPPALVKVDVLVLAFGALQLVLFIPYEAFTNTLRRAFLYGIDTYVLYFVFSRLAASKLVLRDTMASFWLACFVLVPVTIFERLKGWLLYVNIPERWGVPNEFAWLFRDDALRAQASGGHSLTMGYLFAIALGMWLYLGARTQSKRWLWAVGIMIWGGLFATYSRSPWVTAAATLFAYLLISPAGRRNILKTVTAMIVLIVPLSMTSFGTRIVNTLPFIGTVEQENVEYRQLVNTVSWRLIKQNPFFGDPFASNKMEELRQGQGIIDLLNTYAGVSVFNGLVGCALFVGCFAYPLWRSSLVLNAARLEDPDGANMGAALVACLLGTLLMMYTASFGSAFEVTAWVLAGLCSGYPAAMHAKRSTLPLPSRTAGSRVRSVLRES